MTHNRSKQIPPVDEDDPQQQTIRSSLAQIHYQALLLENVQDAIVVWEASGQITYWNQAATDLFGFTAQERIGCQVSEVYLKSFKPEIAISGTDLKHPALRQYTRPDGKKIWLRSRLSTLQQPGDNTPMIGFIDASQDISEQIQAEDALHKSEARYKAMVENYQTDLICRFKPNGHLTYVNHIFCQYFGLEREKLLGMNFLYFIPQNERAKLIQHWTGFSADKKIAAIEHSVFVPQKGLRWLQRTDRAIFDANGKILEFQFIGRDITEQKRMQQQIQAAQAQLVQAARLATIGEIASGVAHQIYNPLTTIIADAQILMHKLGPNMPGRESAEAIEQAGWRLQNVVQQLLAFSEPAAETFEMLSVNDTIQEALSLVSEQISHAGIQLVYHLSQNLPKMRGNARKLENLWLNLILLARDASVNCQGQKILIVTKPIREDTILVEIHDQGESIHEEQLASIFEPNFMGELRGRGSGMELSICREIVRQHGGQISAESALDHDTIFRVVFPGETSV
jgi:PAS domain S-box-containing protein